MITREYIDAKKVLDFVLEKATKNKTKKDIDTIEFANLHILKYRCQAVLNSLQSYEIEIHE